MLHAARCGHGVLLHACGLLRHWRRARYQVLPEIKGSGEVAASSGEEQPAAGAGGIIEASGLQSLLTASSRDEHST